VYRTEIAKTPVQKGESLLDFSGVVLLSELLLELVRSFLLPFLPSLLSPLRILLGSAVKAWISAIVQGTKLGEVDTPQHFAGQSRRSD
jgi:hypothetical protein